MVSLSAEQLRSHKTVFPFVKMAERHVGTNLPKKEEKGKNSSTLITEIVNFVQVISIDSPPEMFEYIGEDKITTDMGGTLEFDANEWTQHRSVSYSEIIEM